MMKVLKSHATFTKQKRHGIFLLLIIIVCLQCVYFFVDKPSSNMPIQDAEITAYIREIDSLRLVEIENRKPKMYPFNPNFMTDYKGYVLGMSNQEIDRLLSYRAKGKWINSVKGFQEITKVSDSLLEKISPYFKFPEWVTNPKPRKWIKNKTFNTLPKTYEQKIDLNTATAIQLKKVNGIGEKLSKRIIVYRNKSGGRFISDIQLQEVYGLSPEVIQRVRDQFTVKTPKTIHKINLNKATREELVTIKYIDYEIAHHILEQRTLHEGFKSLDELTKVKDFPVHKIEIIKLYLTLD